MLRRATTRVHTERWRFHDNFRNSFDTFEMCFKVEIKSRSKATRDDKVQRRLCDSGSLRTDSIWTPLVDTRCRKRENALIGVIHNDKGKGWHVFVQWSGLRFRAWCVYRMQKSAAGRSNLDRPKGESVRWFRGESRSFSFSPCRSCVYVLTSVAALHPARITAAVLTRIQCILSRIFPP